MFLYSFSEGSGEIVTYVELRNGNTLTFLNYNFSLYKRIAFEVNHVIFKEISFFSSYTLHIQSNKIFYAHCEMYYNYIYVGREPCETQIETTEAQKFRVYFLFINY
jgi:hypothetical protein